MAGAAAVAMGIKLSAVSADERLNSTDGSSQRLRGAFWAVFSGLIAVLRQIVLPHMLAAFGLFVLAALLIFKTGAGVAAPLSWFLSLPLIGLFGVAAFVYGVGLAVVFSVHAVAAHVEDFLYALFESVKDKAFAQIDATMDEGIAKQQAKVILDNSVRQAFAPLKAMRLSRAPSAIAGVFLSLMTLVTRSVFLARLARLSTSTVHLSAIFASRATLVGALLLNLRWLSALLLWLLYAFGGIVLVFILWGLW